MSTRLDTWMPLYWGDYLRDTMHLSTEQHGAYLLLIAHYWMTGEPIPDDDKVLRSITKISPHKWKNFRGALEEFFRIEDGRWHHKRIEEEIKKAEARSHKAGHAATEGWKKRRASSGASSIARADARAMPGTMLNESKSQSQSQNTTLREVVDNSARDELASVSCETRDLADIAWDLAECAKSVKPLHAGAVSQWIADGVTEADLKVIPEILKRERARRREPNLVVPLSYYTQAVMDAMRERLNEQAAESIVSVAQRVAEKYLAGEI